MRRVGVSMSQTFAENSVNKASELAGLAAMGARRLLILGGIGLILTGMFFGDIFAVYTLHQNAAQVGANLAAAANAALSGNRQAVLANFRNVGMFLENRGTKVDTHVHMIDFGYLALLLAILQPWVGFAESRKKQIAWVFLAGARVAVDDALTRYGQLQGAKAVNIAAHAHSVEFGLFAIMMAFFQPYVSLRARWKRRWAEILLLGSLLLPVCVLLEMKYGLVAGGVADFGGLLDIVALLAMWIWILRYTVAFDAAAGSRVRPVGS